MDNSPAFTALRTFRTALHACFTRRWDSLFELTDALPTGSPAPSPAPLSLEPVHRRGWGSLYAALARGRIDTEALQARVARTAPPAPDAPSVYAVDVSVWPRCDA